MDTRTGEAAPVGAEGDLDDPALAVEQGKDELTHEAAEEQAGSDEDRPASDWDPLHGAPVAGEGLERLGLLEGLDAEAANTLTRYIGTTERVVSQAKSDGKRKVFRLMLKEASAIVAKTGVARSDLGEVLRMVEDSAGLSELEMLELLAGVSTVAVSATGDEIDKLMRGSLPIAGLAAARRDPPASK